MLINKKYLLIGFLVLFCGPALALNFTAKHIQFKGLQRITPKTALSYMPVKPGDKITQQKSNQIIQKLYQTDFFNNISLSRHKNTLIVHVEERPIISHLKIVGNNALPSKALRHVLDKMGIKQSHEYDKAAVKKIKNALLGQYYAMGHFNAQVHVDVKHETPHQVDLKINISEGQAAKIKNIVIKGNHAYGDSTLIDHMDIDANSWFGFITNSDRFSSQKLSQGLQHLTQFYKNHGYKSFKVVNYNTSITPDRKHVYINLTVKEGQQYHFGSVQFEGKLPYSKERLKQLVKFHKNDIYSQQTIQQTKTALNKLLGKKGFVNVDIKTHAHVNQQSNQVDITFEIKPGKRIYVRHINFIGNDKTNDQAFRRTLHQFEGAPISTEAIKQSRQNLLQLPFVRHVSMSKKSVKGHPNEVDLNYNIKTAPAGEIKAGIGYSDVNGIMLNSSITQKNFLGTGNRFGVQASYSKTSLSAGVHYFNPYYTTSGIGRGYNIYAQRYNANEANLTNFTTNNYGASLSYSFPFDQYDHVSATMGIDMLRLKTGSNPSDRVRNFQNEHGSGYVQIPLSLGWTRNSLDRSIFPQNGWHQSMDLTVSVPVTSDSLQYYKWSYSSKYYLQIYHDFVLKLRGDAGYGDGYGSYDRLPFMKNFYVGGMGSIRGYDANTIGPHDSKDEAIGGNLFFDGSASLIVPNPISDNLRTSLFVDGGNLYDTQATSKEKSQYQYRGRIRLSSGVEFDWFSPMGMLKFSLAKALNATDQDDTQLFQFNIGTSF